MSVDRVVLRRAVLRAALRLGRGCALGLSAVIEEEAATQGLDATAALEVVDALRRAHLELAVARDPSVTALWIALWLRVDTTGPVGRIDDGTKRRLREIAA